MSRHQKGKNIFDSATSTINEWTGGTGAVKVSILKFFGQVFKKHSFAEAEDIFAVGTENTTPSIQDLQDQQVQPWFFSRVLFFIAVVAILMFLLEGQMNQPGLMIALMIVITVSVPIAATILFFEANIYRNISVLRVIIISLIGGLLSLILTMVFKDITGTQNTTPNYWGALITGLTEEAGKVLIAAYFVKQLNSKSIFNGLLIGAAVGSGFAAFENICYMVDGQSGELVGITGVLNRALFSIADHTEWCAIATAGLIIANRNHDFRWNSLLSNKFLRFFILVVVIHALWDLNALDNLGDIRYIILICVTWTIVLIMIHAGLREFQQLKLIMKYNNPEKDPNQ